MLGSLAVVERLGREVPNMCLLNGVEGFFHPGCYVSFCLKLFQVVEEGLYSGLRFVFRKHKMVVDRN